MSRPSRPAAPPPELRPRQERSRRTRRDLLEAAARLISEHGVDGAAVADIAREAGTSVGNVYRRFPSKAALIRAMEEELLAGRRAWWDALLDVRRWRDRDLPSLVGTVVDEVVRRHNEHRDLLRAVALHVRQEYESRVAPVGEGPAARLADLILELWPDAVGHPEPRRAVALAFEMVSATAGELILFRRGGDGAPDVEDEGLARELTRAALGYLRG